MVLERIAEFLRELLLRHDHDRARNEHMSIDLKAILDKLNRQGQQLTDQGTTIAKLIADRDAKEQADLDKINAMIDANQVLAAKNTDLMVAAIQPEGSSGGDAPASGAQQPAPVITVPVAATVGIGSTVIPVTTDTPVPVGSGIASSGTVAGSTVIASDTTSLTLSAPTIDTHAAGDTLTVTPPAAA